MRRPLLLAGVGVLALALVVVLVAVDPSGVGRRSASTPAPCTPGPAGDLTTVLSSGFDEDEQGWEPLGDGVDVSTTGSVTRSGAGSLLVTGRSETWHGAAVDVSGTVAPGACHTVEAWVRLAGEPRDSGHGEDPVEVQLTLERIGDEPLYLHPARAQVGAGDWVRVDGAARLPTGGDGWRLYVETTGSLADLRVDDVVVQRPSRPVQEDVPALRDAVAFPVGTAVAAQDLEGRPAELLARHFDQVTPENAMKPTAVQPQEGVFDFAPMDAVLDAAVEQGLTVHGHTIVWHRSTPDWFFDDASGRELTNSPEDRALLLDRLEAHMRAIADHLRQRYGDANPVRSWDVVNEALDPAEVDGLRRSAWYRVLGPDYVAESFRIAREVFGSDVTLYLNDYDTDAPGRSRALVALLERLRADGAPVDAVGHQMHLRLGASVDRVDAVLDAVADLGLQQSVTELDIALSGPDEVLEDVGPDLLEEQGAMMEDLAATFTEHASSLGFVSVWGLYDTRSWLRSWPRDDPLEAPLLFDDDLQAKPAFWGFVRGAGDG